MPNISVVIPLYNKAAYVRRALDSVLLQTYPDFEVLVVDDGSTDGSGGVVRHYGDPRIRLLTQQNAGASAARNRGINEAAGRLIAFLDADDEWKPTFLQTIARLAVLFPSCGAYSTAYDIVQVDGRRSSLLLSGLPRPPWEGIIPDYFRTALSTTLVWTSATAVPRAVFDAVGCFPVGEEQGEDLDMWCRIALKHRIAFSTNVDAVYHKEAGARSADLAADWREYRLFTTIDSALAGGELAEWVSPDCLREYRNRKLIAVAVTCLARRDVDQAKRYLQRAQSTRRFRLIWRLLMLLSAGPARIAGPVAGFFQGQYRRGRLPLAQG